MLKILIIIFILSAIYSIMSDDINSEDDGSKCVCDKMPPGYCCTKCRNRINEENG